jgi:uncharacterized damage-inducible protein DinB
MRTADILTLYDYNYWANARVLRAAARLTAAQFTAPAGISQGSLRGALVHAMSAEQIWRLRLQGALTANRFLSEEQFPDLASLHAAWTQEELEMRAYLGSLTDGSLERVIAYRATSGMAFSNRVWEILAQVVMHGVQTRSEAAVVLTGLDASPAGLDLILFLRERPGL